jgi:hypothetical protein
VCAAGKCIATCTADTDCMDGYSCYPETHACGPTKPKCDGDHTVTLVSGGTKDCSPYKCQPTGDCFVECATADDCLPGFACAAGSCSQTGGAGGDSGGGGGCDVPSQGEGQGAPTYAAGGVLIVTTLIGVSRRRRVGRRR